MARFAFLSSLALHALLFVLLARHVEPSRPPRASSPVLVVPMETAVVTSPSRTLSVASLARSAKSSLATKPLPTALARQDHAPPSHTAPRLAPELSPTSTPASLPSLLVLRPPTPVPFVVPTPLDVAQAEVGTQEPDTQGAATSGSTDEPGSASAALPAGADLSVFTAPEASDPSDGPAHPLVPDGAGGYTAKATTWSAHILADGSVAFSDQPNVTIDPVLAPVLAGHFDLTDMVMRAHGDDPYLSQKRSFLADTLALREAMAQSEGVAAMKTALAALPAYLLSVWSNRTDSAASRRKTLFRLWDDCTESGSADDVAGGVAARSEIVTFIDAELPQGSKDGYPAAELQTLNSGRSSREIFDPYKSP